MKMRTCCVIGYAGVSEETLKLVKSVLEREILWALQDGYIHYISSFAKGVDQIFVQIVSDLKKDHRELYLEAVIPCRDCLTQLLGNRDTRLLLCACNAIGIYGQHHSGDYYMKCNQFMMQASDMIIVIKGERNKGSTAQTLQFARAAQKEVRIIPI